MNYQLIAPRIPNVSLVEQVLINRGIAQSEVPHYLNTSDDDILSPLLLDNIEPGARLLIKHISQHNKIHICVDSDTDGYTSSAVLINYLNRLFPYYTQNYITYSLHSGKEHGINISAVPEGTKLVIAPDSSSNEADIHSCLRSAGIETLVLDHHHCETGSADAIIINNQLCDYPNKSLSGVGIVYKFCSYIDELLNQSTANDFLDLVALGLVADVMSLLPMENRRLITLGLENINNPFFSTMVERNSFSLGSKVIPFGVAFYIAPYINAVTRCGDDNEKLLLFESMLEYKAYEEIPSTKRGCKGQFETRVEQACRTCNNVKNRQTKSRDTATEIIENLIVENNLLDNKILVVTLDSEHSIDKGLTGLVANQIANKYQRPTLILSETKIEGIKAWAGSGRNCGTNDLEDFRAFVESSGFASYAEGHGSAFGAAIPTAQLLDFITYSNKELSNYDFSSKYYIDFEFDVNNITSEDILGLADFDYLWGHCVEEPQILIKNIKVKADNLQLLKGTTLKLKLTENINCIKFKSNEEEYNQLYSDMGCITINVIGLFQKNEWNGYINPQIQILDYEIVNKQQYYF